MPQPQLITEWHGPPPPLVETWHDRVNNIGPDWRPYCYAPEAQFLIDMADDQDQ